MIATVDDASPLAIACVILAAGAGSRFGEPKAGAEVRPGVRFVDAVAETARVAGAAPVIVVAPAGLLLPPGTIGVINANPRGEQVHSLRLGLAQLVSVAVGGVLAWPVDHPFVDVASVRSIMDAAKRTGAPIVLPVFEGRRGHPVYFSRDCWRDLATVREGGARAVVHARAAEIVEVSVNNIGVVRDIDTRADMANGQGASGNAVS
jgi:CTP:molybdopterin cytidylyltransferase MocA